VLDFLVERRTDPQRLPEKVAFHLQAATRHDVIECRFTLEPETGPIRVRSGTEIETDASLSLNLSANFVALSGESGLLFDCGLPGFDDGV
jgi:hypothetical protein